MEISVTDPRVLATCDEILTMEYANRGYEIVYKDTSPSRIIDESPTSIWRGKRSKMGKMGKMGKMDAGEIEVLFINNAKDLSVNAIKEIKKYTEMDTKQRILVCSRDMTCHARKLLKEFAAEDVEFFTADELIINPMVSSLVPMHSLLAGDELESFLRRFDKGKIPIINSTDMVARFMGLRQGDIVKIARCPYPYCPIVINDADHIGHAVMYRVCKTSLFSLV